jgi:hypothetical protein
VFLIKEGTCADNFWLLCWYGQDRDRDNDGPIFYNDALFWYEGRFDQEIKLLLTIN